MRVTVASSTRREKGRACAAVAGSTTSSNGFPTESRCFLKRQLLSRPPRFVNVAITSSVSTWISRSADSLTIGLDASLGDRRRGWLGGGRRGRGTSVGAGRYRRRVGGRWLRWRHHKAPATGRALERRGKSREERAVPCNQAGLKARATPVRRGHRGHIGRRRDRITAGRSKRMALGQAPDRQPATAQCSMTQDRLLRVIGAGREKPA